ncbi:hypothetical protein Ddc_16319 [Ditylenchus destructor]|nr:hypothetical protein Ddc_16319 [Ditylenchus destructor]
MGLKLCQLAQLEPYKMEYLYKMKYHTPGTRVRRASSDPEKSRVSRLALTHNSRKNDAPAPSLVPIVLPRAEEHFEQPRA